MSMQSLPRQEGHVNTEREKSVRERRRIFADHEEEQWSRRVLIHWHPPKIPHPPSCQPVSQSASHRRFERCNNIYGNQYSPIGQARRNIRPNTQTPRDVFIWRRQAVEINRRAGRQMGLH
eukprot:COSAG05_NODE_950_length_6467_cov_231.083857_4_plen_120_part_00